MTLMSKLLRMLCVLVAVGGWHATAVTVTYGAQFEALAPLRVEDDDDQFVRLWAPCSIMMRGTIEAGDAEKLAMLLSDLGRRSFHELLCLDSPGGSFVAGMDLVDVLRTRGVATKVDVGMRCESACALVFMAGSVWANESGLYSQRILHPKAKLGFHAPSLAVAGAGYTAQEVDRAYKLALSTISATLTRLVQQNDFADGVKMQPSLLAQMLDTPASEMFYITTIGEAARWHITLAPVEYPSSPDGTMYLNACQSVYDWTNDRTARAHGAGEDWLVTEEASEFGYTIIKTIINEMTGDSCEFQIRNPQALDEFDNVILPDRSTFRGDLRLALFDPEMLLVDLPIGGGPVAKAGHQAGVCQVFKNSISIDLEPCTAADESVGSGSSTTYTWPSGAQTVVAVTNGTTRINGNATGATEVIQGMSCTLNPQSGNLFCFRAD